MNKIIGIDPSTNFIGVSIITINKELNAVKAIETTAIDISKTESFNPLNNNLLYRLRKLTQLIYKVMEEHQPLAVGMESPFMNQLRPASALPLGQSVQAIQHGVFKYKPHMVVGMYPPSTVKNAVGAKGGGDKDAVLKAIQKIPELKSKMNFNLLTDHEVDATAIAYALLQDIRHNPLILI